MKKQNGITLAVLVITVIVLLILAGVTITSLSGENGIIKNTKKSKEQSEIKEIKEQIQIEIFDKQNQKIWNILTEDEIKQILQKYGEPSLEGEPKTLTTENGTVIDITQIYNDAISEETNQ